MKKLLAVLVAAIMVFGISTVAFAETYTFGSQSNAVEVSGDGITVTDSSILLTREEAAEKIGNGAQTSQVAIVLNGKDITAPSTPVTVNFTVNGTASPQKLFVFHYTDGAWKIEGSGDPKTVTITVDKLSPFAVVVFTPASSGGNSGNNGGKSPKTGEGTALPIAMGLVIAAGAAAFVLAPRKRA